MVYFVNSGSEANDLAMMMARMYSGCYDLVSFRNAYHGMSPATNGLTAHSTWRYNVAGNFGIHQVSMTGLLLAQFVSLFLLFHFIFIDYER